ANTKECWRDVGHTSSEFVEESSPSKIYEAIRHDSPGFTRERYSLHKPVRLLRNGEQRYVKCPHERGWPLPFANCVKLRIRGNAWKWAGVVGDSPWLIRELEDESFPSATCPRQSVLPIRLRPDFSVVFEGYAGGAEH
ncbi:MAG: hypothetical protein ACK4TL_16540, partial [Hyphomicrobiaceae bacterium]